MRQAVNKDTRIIGGFRSCYRTTWSIPDNTEWREGGIQAAGQTACSGCSCGEGGHSNRGSACKPQNHSQIGSRTAPGVERRGVPPTSCEGKGGVCRATLGNSWEVPGLSTGWCAHSWDRPWGTVGVHWEEGPCHHASPPSPPLRMSLPPEMKGRTLTVTPTLVPSGKFIRDLAPGWRLVMWWCLPSPSKMPVPRKGAGLTMNFMVSANSIGAGSCP